jgi:hypothetical protein
LRGKNVKVRDAETDCIQPVNGTDHTSGLARKISYLKRYR